MASKRPMVLLLEGGNDISPTLYGATTTYTRGVSIVRDTREIDLYKRARKHHVPILGICRGHQLMAALEGGTLYQDIEKELGKRHDYEHTIKFTHAATASGFRELMESNPTGSPDVVNSLHHQAVKVVPTDGRVLAFAADMTPEAILYPWGLSAQWHPEFLGHVEFIQFMYDRFYSYDNA